MSLLKALVLIGGAVSQLPAGDTVADWNNIANLPATFPPSAHVHAITDTTGLQAALDAKAPLASPAFTGAPTASQLTVNAGSLVIDRVGDAAAAQFLVRRDAGQNADFNWQTGTLARYTWRMNNTAEGGANAGSDFQWLAYDDSGTLLGNILAITRSTRIVAFTVSPTVPTPSAADNSTKVASTAYVDTAIGAAFAANDALLFKGTIDASANPNYPAADAGHVYRISVAGKIGGASGPNVEIGDTLYAIVDGSAAGTHAAVGANWVIVQSNLDGAVIGPASVTSGNPVVFSGTTGKLIAEQSFATFKTNLALNFTDLAGTLANAQLSGAYTGFTTISLATSITWTGNSGGFAGVAAAGFNIRTTTADAADTSAVQISGGGGVASSGRGGGIQLYGNEHATLPGDVVITPGTAGTFDVVGSQNISAALDVGGGLSVDGLANLNSDLTVGANAIINGSLDVVGNMVGASIDLAGNLTAINAFLAGTIVGEHASGIFVRTNTADAADTKGIFLSGGGANNAVSRGGGVQVHGNEHATFPGVVRLYPGTGATLELEGATNVTGALNATGSVDAAGNLSTAGVLFYSGAAVGANFDIRHATSDGSDNRAIRIAGGGAIGTNRGGLVDIYGNEHATFPGEVHILRGSTGFVRIDGTIVNTGVFGGFLWATQAWNPGSIVNQGVEYVNVTVTGAAVGDLAHATLSTAVDGWVVEARVSAANTVRCRLENDTGATGDLASGTLNVMVFRAP